MLDEEQTRGTAHTPQQRYSLQVCRVRRHVLPPRGLHGRRRSRRRAHPHTRRPHIEPLAGGISWKPERDCFFFVHGIGFLMNGRRGRAYIWRVLLFEADILAALCILLPRCLAMAAKTAFVCRHNLRGSVFHYRVPGQTRLTMAGWK